MMAGGLIRGSVEVSRDGKKGNKNEWRNKDKTYIRDSESHIPGEGELGSVLGKRNT